MCANILSISLLQAEYSNKIKGVKVGRSGISFTHLFFADDSLLFFKNDRNSLGNIQSILNWYCSISGQKINLAKFDLFCSPNMAKECQVSVAKSLNVNLVQHPSEYLGITSKLRRNRIIDFNFLIDKLHSKLQGWKSRLLSQAGRTTLISFVPQSLPLYTFSCFKVPKSICNKMDAIVGSFWWGHEPGEKKLHLINWDKICKPKRWGGLGIKKFSPMNQALLEKQYWRLINSPQSLLARTFKAKYHPDKSLQGHRPKAHHS